MSTPGLVETVMLFLANLAWTSWDISPTAFLKTVRNLGTGPFKFVKGEDDQILLEKNTEY
jgi:ABC-type transport system substrate-binding protein